MHLKMLSAKWRPCCPEGYELKLIVARWGHMALDILVNTGSGKGLLPDGTKPLPEPMLSYHQ